MKGVPEGEALKRTDVYVDEIAEVLAHWDGLVNLKDAASRLAITPAKVKALMKLDVLASIQITSSLRYTQDRIKAFEQKWITLGQKAEADGIEPYHLARRLDRDGVATMPCVTGFVRVYARGVE